MRATSIPQGAPDKLWVRNRSGFIAVLYQKKGVYSAGMEILEMVQLYRDHDSIGKITQIFVFIEFSARRN
jgi:hypothetical protein